MRLRGHGEGSSCVSRWKSLSRNMIQFSCRRLSIGHRHFSFIGTVGGLINTIVLLHHTIDIRCAWLHPEVLCYSLLQSPLRLVVTLYVCGGKHISWLVVINVLRRIDHRGICTRARRDGIRCCAASRVRRVVPSQPAWVAKNLVFLISHYGCQGDVSSVGFSGSERQNKTLVHRLPFL